MKALLRATALLSTASFATILISLVTSKANAVLIGPDGVGLNGLIQSLLGLSTLVAGLGISTGLVREVSAALARDDLERVAALKRAAHLVTRVSGAIAALLLLLFRAQTRSWFLGTYATAWYDLVFIGLALLLTLSVAVDNAFLNGYQRIGALTRVAIVNSASGAVVTISLVFCLRLRGVAPALFAVAAVNWLLTRRIVRSEIGDALPTVSGAAVRADVRRLLRFGIPITASSLLGSGIQLGLPLLVLRLLDRESVGYYRAASAISVSYLGFLISAMSQDYYPRLSGAPSDPATLRRLLNDQLQLVMLVGLPLVLALLLVSPQIIPIVSSKQFVPAIPLLQWQLVGDLLRLTSWTMAFMVLARCGSIAYFACEAFSGVSFLGFSYLGVRLFGLPGMGIAFFLSYLSYALVTAGVLFYSLKVRLSARNALWVGLAVVALVAAQCAPLDRTSATRVMLYSCLLIPTSIFSFMKLRGFWVSGKEA